MEKKNTMNTTKLAGVKYELRKTNYAEGKGPALKYTFIDNEGKEYGPVFIGIPTRRCFKASKTDDFARRTITASLPTNLGNVIRDCGYTESLKTWVIDTMLLSMSAFATIFWDCGKLINNAPNDSTFKAFIEESAKWILKTDDPSEYGVKSSYTYDEKEVAYYEA